MAVVKIGSVQIHRYRRPLARPWVDAGGIQQERFGAILILKSDDGLTGYGEAAPLPGRSRESADDAYAQLNELAGRIKSVSLPETLVDLTAAIHDFALPQSPSVIMALETALFDLASRTCRRSLCRWFSDDCRMEIPVNYVVSNRESIPDVVAAVASGGYPSVKVKVGRRPFDEDAAFVRDISKALGPGVELRLDANRSWDLNQALDSVKAFRNVNLEYIEEPLRNASLNDLSSFREKSGYRVALDESLAEVADPTSIISHSACDVVIIKPTLLGGLVAARKLAHHAERMGKKVVISSSLESEIGLAALFHLAATLGENLLACGLDTARFLEGNDPSRLVVQHGCVAIPKEQYGLGWNLAFPNGTAL